MTLFYENETEQGFTFLEEEVALAVVEKALELHFVEYPAQVSVTVVSKEKIKEINCETRQMDKETDVLSFPNLPFENEGDFRCFDFDNDYYEYFDPDSEELILGEIILCREKISMQAKEYGHSEKREYAFLIAHSILHLLGYDHMEEEERKRMEDMQRTILNALNITREDE